MDGDPRRKLEEKRERWHKRAGAAFERMWANGKLTTFTDHEDEACLIAEELAAFLLEEKLAEEAQVRPVSAAEACCPKCRKPGERVTKAKERLPERTLTTRAGEVTLRREKWRCRTCRVLFFSARPKAETGDGGLQSASAAEGGAAVGQGRVVPRRQ